MLTPLPGWQLKNVGDCTHCICLLCRVFMSLLKHERLGQPHDQGSKKMLLSVLEHQTGWNRCFSIIILPCASLSLLFPLYLESSPEQRNDFVWKPEAEFITPSKIPTLLKKFSTLYLPDLIDCHFYSSPKYFSRAVYKASKLQSLYRYNGLKGSCQVLSPSCKAIIWFW